MGTFTVIDYIVILILTIVFGILFITYRVWLKAIREKSTCGTKIGDELHKKISMSLARAVSNTKLNRSQDIAIVQIVESLFHLLLPRDLLGSLLSWNYMRRRPCYQYSYMLENIQEIVIEYSLPNQVMITATELVYEAIQKSSSKPGPVFSDLAKFMKDLKQES